MKNDIFFQMLFTACLTLLWQTVDDIPAVASVGPYCRFRFIRNSALQEYACSFSEAFFVSGPIVTFWNVACALKLMVSKTCKRTSDVHGNSLISRCTSCHNSKCCSTKSCRTFEGLSNYWFLYWVCLLVWQSFNFGVLHVWRSL